MNMNLPLTFEYKYKHYVSPYYSDVPLSSLLDPLISTLSPFSFFTCRPVLPDK